MNAASLLQKSQIALRSAHHLLAIGDNEGAADRAYFALFHAARAVLAYAAPEDTPRLKSHAGVISAFGRIGVGTLGLAPQHGRLLNFAEDLRLKADYDSAVFADRQAIEDIITAASSFLVDVGALIDGQKP